MSSSDRAPLRFLRLEDEVVLVRARDRHVRRDLDDVEVVDLDELLLLRLRRPRHAGELLVEAEVVLERDRRERDVLLADRDALLRLDRLVQALAPATALHDAARELVDDLHLVVLHDVVDVALVERLRLERLRQVVDELDMAGVVEVVDPERALDLVERRLRGRDRLELLVVEVVGARELRLVLALHHLPRERRPFEVANHAREVVVRLRRGLGLAGDDERRPRLVDQDRVDLVDDRERVAALHRSLERDGHVVAQVVESELRVRPVRDVGRVRLAPARERHHVLDRGDGDAQPVEHGLVPLGVALREVVVDRHEMDVLARERVQVERRARHERLALAGLHLGDAALVERDPAHQLDVEEALPGLPLARLAHGSERLVEDVVERLAVRDPLLELGGLREQLGVGQILEIGLERGDVRGLLRKALEAAALAETEDLLEPAEARGGHGQRVPGSRGATRAPTFPNGFVMRPSRARAHDAHVKRIVPALAALGAVVLTGTAAALLTPGRSVANAAPVSALSVTGSSVAYAVGRTKADCGTVRLWDTGSRGLWTFGSSDDRRLRGGVQRRLRDRAGRDLGAARLLGDERRRQHHRLPALDRDPDAHDTAQARIRVVGDRRAACDRARERHARRRPVRRRRHRHLRRRERRPSLPHRSR